MDIVTTIKKTGNSLMILLPKVAAKNEGMDPGKKVHVTIKIIEPALKSAGIKSPQLPAPKEAKA